MPVPSGALHGGPGDWWGAGSLGGEVSGGRGLWWVGILEAQHGFQEGCVEESLGSRRSVDIHQSPPHMMEGVV